LYYRIALRQAIDVAKRGQGLLPTSGAKKVTSMKVEWT